MTLRQEIYAAIEGERVYQDGKWGTIDEHGHSLPEWLMFIEDYVNEAKHAYTRLPDPEVLPKVLHTMRKIAALAVVAQEQHGVLHRVMEGARPMGATYGA